MIGETPAPCSTMIREHLVRSLLEHFPDRNFTILDQDKPFATLEAPCKEIGRLELYDDGYEITLYITEITHGHFGCYDDDNPTTEEKELRISNAVVDFIKDLFHDRVVMYSFVGAHIGGWSVLEEGKIHPSASKLKRQFVWSHEIK